MGEINYRRAEGSDVFAIMELYQMATMTPDDPLLLNFRQLKRDIESISSLWIVADRGGEILAFLSILVDPMNRLAKINRFFTDPDWSDSKIILQEAVPLLIHYLSEKAVEVVYTTTRTLTKNQQEFTLSLGFRTIGIFPHATGQDGMRVNGIAAYFADGVLQERRRSDFKLHPIAMPFYELVRDHCALPALAEAPAESYRIPEGFDPLPSMEIIHAPRFVSHRFGRLKEKRSLAVHFYPFHEPNALITDPAQRIEVFVRLEPENKFAAIIGERLDLPVNPAELYNEISLMLNRRGISYIEMINDAADPTGIECIYNAGYLPCAYFPAFKSQGDLRRDFVVFARSSERLISAGSPGLAISESYLGFLRRYYEIEEHAQLGRLV